MTLSTGRRLGPYELVAPIGAGGMGEVWRARDTRLDRTVAIKVLPAGLSANAQLRMRFEREAKTISQLGHPHICTLYDVGHEDGIDFLVMEHLEGETLADRLAKGPLPVQQVLRYGVEIAAALERAHRAGVVHRDLKPGNIMLTKSGAKLLDFGLAKPSPETAGSQNAVTEQRPLTEEGTIVGTFQYMAPEQIEGRPADHRADLFAFGVVLYEMATGRRAFEGKTRASLIAAILDREPEPMSSVQPLTPPALEHVVRRCLAKDPEDRWQTAHDVRLQLEWIAQASGAAAAPAAGVRSGRRFTSVALVLAILAAIIFAALYARKAMERPRVVEAAITPPDKMIFAFRTGSGPPALSPDGTRVVFTAKTSNTGDRGMLWIRSLDEGEARPVNGTAGASYPFWSPDGANIGFFADGKLKRIALNGATPVVLCDSPAGRGGAWHGDTILFGNRFDVIYRTNSSGAAPAKLTKLDPSESTHRWPLFLADGRHFLYLTSPTGAVTARNAVWISSLDQPAKRRKLLSTPANVAIAGDYLFYVRERALVAQRFDPKRLALTGEPIPIAPSISLDTLYSRAMFDATESTLVLQRGGESTARLVLLDRKGVMQTDYDVVRALLGPRLSPDQTQVAMVLLDARTAVQNIWIMDRARHTVSRFTFGARDVGPVWSPDGKWIAYAAEDQGSTRKLVLKPTDGSAGEHVLLRGGNDTLAQPVSWSSDGRTLMVVRHQDRASENEVWAVSVGDGTARRLMHGRGLNHPQLSPDGRWLAYIADENGSVDVYLTRYPDLRGRWQVSSGESRFPKWSKDGKEIYYISGSEMLTAVRVDGSGEAPRFSSPETLFHLSLASNANAYDPTSEGNFIVAVPVFDESQEPLTLITNWKAKLGLQ